MGFKILTVRNLLYYAYEHFWNVLGQNSFFIVVISKHIGQNVAVAGCHTSMCVFEK